MKDSTKHVADSVSAWLAGELDPQETTAFERHLESCSGCARAARASRAVWEALETAALHEDETAAPSVWPGVRARTLDRRNGESWFYGASAVARGGLAATALAAGLFVAVILPGGGLNSSAELTADVAPEAALASVETMWLEDSSWTSNDQDNELDRLWIIAGLD